MTKKELVEMLDEYDDNAEIVTFNYTTFRWYKTNKKENYPIYTVEKLMNICGNNAKKQLNNFNLKDIAIVL